MKKIQWDIFIFDDIKLSLLEFVIWKVYVFCILSQIIDIFVKSVYFLVCS